MPKQWFRIISSKRTSIFVSELIRILLQLRLRPIVFCICTLYVCTLQKDFLIDFSAVTSLTLKVIKRINLHRNLLILPLKWSVFNLKYKLPWISDYQKNDQDFCLEDSMDNPDFPAIKEISSWNVKLFKSWSDVLFKFNPIISSSFFF